MKKVFVLLTVASLVWMPVAAFAQDAAVEDGGVVAEDGSTTTADAAVAEDATTAVEDGGTTTADAATGTDAATDTDAAQAGCGDLTIIGACSGDTLRYCSQGELVEIDCAQNSLSCAMVDCDSEADNCWGYDCVAGAGDACGFAQGESLCEAAAGMGCIDGVCATASTCTEDRGTFVSCTGDVANICFNGTVQNLDCSNGAADPYTCAAPADSTTSPCVGLAGGECGTGSSGTEFGCASGLVCTGGICTAASSGTDAGSTGTDAGTSGGSDASTGSSDGDGDDASGCGCAATRTGSGAALILAGLLGLVAIRRRR